MIRGLRLVVFPLLLLASSAAAQPLFTRTFPPEEFAARRARVMEQIGSDAIAVVQGAGESPVLVRFQQNSNFFYLTGVEVANALLLLDGRTKTATLFLPPRDEVMARLDGAILAPGPEAAKLTGIPQVFSREEFAVQLDAVGRYRKILYAPVRRESMTAAIIPDRRGHRALAASDPWDGRLARETAFIHNVRNIVPQLEFRNLDTIVDPLRNIKSAREIAVMREANKIGGLALADMMRATKPGMYEYELEAIGQYFYHAADGYAGYYAQVKSSQDDHSHPRYHYIEHQINDGDLVSIDFGPRYRYYVADVYRMWPASGKFTPVQRELTTAFLQCWTAMEQSIKPNMKPRDVIRDAVAKMDQVQSSFKFTNPKVKEAIAKMIDRVRATSLNSFGHFVGMDVHDIELDHMDEVNPDFVLKPGMVFSIEFALEVELPEANAYAGLENNYVITETGIEDLTGPWVPRDPDAIEKVMAEPSAFRKLGSLTASSIPRHH